MEIEIKVYCDCGKEMKISRRTAQYDDRLMFWARCDSCLEREEKLVNALSKFMSKEDIEDI